MLQRCPECRKKISESATHCPNCGFSFQAEDLERYKDMLEKRRLHNQEVNRKSARLQLIWLLIFALVIGVAAYWVN